jgi:hypothetical protein
VTAGARPNLPDRQAPVCEAEAATTVTVPTRARFTKRLAGAGEGRDPRR